MKFLLHSLMLALALALFGIPSPSQAVSLREAVKAAVHNNPEVLAVNASRRASDFRLRQAQGGLLPRLDITADVGRQYVDQPNGLGARDNRNWRTRKQTTLTVRQILFDGWYRANNIYKSAAQVDAVALRVLQQSEIQGLLAVETYIDVRRLTQLLQLARDNARRHEAILKLIRVRKRGGKSPVSELDQTLERVAAARAIVYEIKQSLLESKARFKRVVGIDPVNMRPVAFPKRVPRARQIAVRIGVESNPAIKAARADIDAAKFARTQNEGSYYPEIALEGSATYGSNIGGTRGKNNDLTGRVVASWNIFNGQITTNRNRELSERWYETKARQDVQKRAVVEAVERAWAAYTVGGSRVTQLRRQSQLNKRLVRTYLEEYRLSKRSLLDLLDSESALFNSRFQLSSIVAVRLFSAYQVLASMGILLDSVGVEAPKEAIAQRRDQTRRNLGVFNVLIEPLRKP
jgi:outer membrane protein, adhesin transport system